MTLVTTYCKHGVPLDTRCLTCRPTPEQAMTTTEPARRVSDEELSGWRALESVPRDGTAFLGCLQSGRVLLMWHPNSNWNKFAWWCTAPQTSVPIAETHFDHDLSDCDLLVRWQPLPEPPAALSRQEG